MFSARPRCVQNPCNYTDRPPPTFVYLSRRTRSSSDQIPHRSCRESKNRASAVAAMQHPMELCLIKSRETFQSLQSDLNGTITTHSHAPQEQVKHTTSLRMFALSEPSHGASSSTPRSQRTVTVLDPLYSVHVILCILSSPRLPASRPAAGGLKLS